MSSIPKPNEIKVAKKKPTVKEQRDSFGIRFTDLATLNALQDLKERLISRRVD